jgi:hypothetical protein
MRIRHALGLALLAVALAACNLTTSPQVTPTPRPTSTPPTPVFTPPPTIPGLPTLLPTPTQVLLPPVVPTVLPGVATPLPGGLPTVDPASAIGRFPASVRAGGTLGLAYDVTITRGALTFTIQGTQGQGLVWQRTFNASEVGRHEFVSAQGGEYELLIQTQNFDGAYNFRWE